MRRCCPRSTGVEMRASEWRKDKTAKSSVKPVVPAGDLIGKPGAVVEVSTPARLRNRLSRFGLQLVEHGQRTQSAGQRVAIRPHFAATRVAEDQLSNRSNRTRLAETSRPVAAPLSGVRAVGASARSCRHSLRGRSHRCGWRGFRDTRSRSWAAHFSPLFARDLFGVRSVLGKIQVDGADVRRELFRCDFSTGFWS